MDSGFGITHCLIIKQYQTTENYQYWILLCFMLTPMTIQLSYF